MRQGLPPQMEGWSPGVLLPRFFLLQTLPLSAAWGSEQRERRKLVSALTSRGLCQVTALCRRKEARREKNLFWGLGERAVSPNNSTPSVFLPGGPLEWTERIVCVYESGSLGRQHCCVWVQYGSRGISLKEQVTQCRDLPTRNVTSGKVEMFRVKLFVWNLAPRAPRVLMLQCQS